MNTKIITGILIVGLVLLGGYRLAGYFNKDMGEVKEVITPVTIQSVEMTTIEDVLIYQGAVAPKKVEQVSFKSSGRLAAIDGNVGDLLEEGHLLTSLETSDLELAVEGARGQLKAAQADYDRALKGARSEDLALAATGIDKAQEAVTYLSNQEADVAAMYEEGVVSLSELEAMRLELALAKEDLTLAKTNYNKAASGTEAEVISAALGQKEMAEVNLAGQASLLEDATYVISKPMVLMETFYEVGELVPAGYPVAILRSQEQQISLGVSGKELKEIYIGQKVTIYGDTDEVEGLVTRIAEIPDQSHFLYEVEVSIAEEMLVGAIVTCHLSLGQIPVIQVPIQVIQNDGIDYVYIMEEGLAVLRKIQILEDTEGVASVSGLNEGDQLIVSNLNRIHEGSLVYGEVEQ